MNAFVHKGYWWLADHDEKKCPGILTFDHDEGLRLQIFGSLSPFTQWPAEYPVINGRTLEGKYFTLFDCDSRRSSIVEPPDYAEEVLSAEYTFERSSVGLGKVLPDARLFHKAFVQYTYLPDWIGRTDFQLAENFDEITERVDQIELVYKTLKEVSADLEDAKISVIEGFNVSNENRAIQGVGIRPIFVFEIEAQQELSFEDWREKFVTPLGDFLTLATGQSNSVAKLSFHSRLNNSDSMGDGRKTLKTTVYYSQIKARVPRKASILREQDRLLGFQDIKDEYPNIIPNWITSRAKFAKSMTLFFAVKNSNGMYLEHEFLTQVQALEIYHRERFKSTVASEIVEEHLAKTKAVVDAAPEEYREWADDQLNLDRQVRLNQRLLELLRHSEPVISRLVKNGEVFAKRVTKTRNFLTHYSSKSKGVMEELELYSASQVSSYMFQTCIMLELELPIEKIVSFFERNQQFRFTANHIKQAYDWS